MNLYSMNANTTSLFATSTVAAVVHSDLRVPYPSFIISAPPPFNSVFFWQCELALRLLERKPEQKFQTASSPNFLQFIKNLTRQTAWRGNLHLT